MTVLEFESWVSDNYNRLLSLYLDGAARRDQNAQDAFHNALEALLGDEGLATVNSRICSEPGFDLFIWVSNHIRGYLKNLRESAKARVNGSEALAIAVATLGDDAYRDTTQEIKRQNSRRAYLAKTKAAEASTLLEGAASHEVRIGHMFHGQLGTSRWRYQTLRDNKLFDLRAVESLRDSIRRAAARYRHFGEHGHSFTEFGGEQFGPGACAESLSGAVGSTPRGAGLFRGYTLDPEPRDNNTEFEVAR